MLSSEWKVGMRSALNVSCYLLFAVKRAPFPLTVRPETAPETGWEGLQQVQPRSLAEAPPPEPGHLLIFILRGVGDSGPGLPAQAGLQRAAFCESRWGRSPFKNAWRAAGCGAGGRGGSIGKPLLRGADGRSSGGSDQ